MLLRMYQKEQRILGRDRGLHGLSQPSKAKGDVQGKEDYAESTRNGHERSRKGGKQPERDRGPGENLSDLSPTRVQQKSYSDKYYLRDKMSQALQK